MDWQGYNYLDLQGDQGRIRLRLLGLELGGGCLEYL